MCSLSYRLDPDLKQLLNDEMKYDGIRNASQTQTTTTIGMKSMLNPMNNNEINGKQDYSCYCRLFLLTHVIDRRNDQLFDTIYIY
jgi:hypothetical protein